MTSKIYTAAAICMLFLLGSNAAFAQLTANAGRDTTICAGSNITLGGAPTATGGTPGYTYLWTPSLGLSSDTVPNPVVNPVSTTTYTVVVTDSALNTSTDTVLVTVNPIPTSTFTVSLPVCVGQAVTITYTGNAPAIPTYSWNFVDGTNIVDLGGVQGPYQTTFNSSGQRYLTLSILQNGCRSVTDSVLINVGGWHFDSLTTVPANCYGDSSGKICIYATDGNPPFTYQWSNFGNAASNCQTVSAGIYSVTAFDNSGCSVSASGNVSQPVQMAISNLTTNATTCGQCNGTINGTITGGTPIYTYYIYDSIGYMLVGFPDNNLCVGTYPLKVQDQNGCSIVDTFTINQVPIVTTDSFTITNVSCFGGSNGSICVSVSGGTPAYTFNWSNGMTGQCVTSLTPGQYNVTITDAHGCSASASATVTQPAPFTDSVAVTNVACYGASSGSICIYVSGGTPAYTFNWSNSLTGQCITSLAHGQYNVTITDAIGCSASASATVTQQPMLTDSVVVTNVSCNGGSNGALCSYPVGGAPPYSYMWSNGGTTQCIESLTAADFILTVTDANQCSATITEVVTEAAAALTFDSVSRSGGWCNDGGATLCDYTSGGTLPYNYLWREGTFSNTATGQCIVTTSEQNWVIVTDANGCFDSVYVIILLPSQLAIQLATPDSNGVPDSVSMIINGGSAPYSVIWGDGQTSNLPDSTVLHVYQAPGIYLDSITDRNGCVTTYLVDAGCSDQCVWPGDANYDGVVDNNDLLAIGVGYDSTGYTRSHPTINFIPQYCQSWNDTLIGGVNFKHVDCNGDGIINANDTDAIVLNYSLTHVRGGSGSLQWRDDAPALYIKTSPDTIGDGEILTATLSLGDISMPLSNVYALAFTYNFDPLVVDTTGVNIAFGNSWLFGTGDHINISKNFYGPGQIQAAATRIDHANRSGYGNIATVSMKITTGNINGKNLQYYLMNNYISNLTVIDNDGHVLVVNAGTDSAVVSYLPTDIITAGNAKGHIQIFPNPATDQLNIVSAQSEIEEITIFDIAGQQVTHQNMQAGNYSIIDISALSAGVYMVKLKTANEEYRSRFVKVSIK